MRDQRSRALRDEFCLSPPPHPPHPQFCHCTVTLSFKPTGSGVELSILHSAHSSITFLRSASISSHSIKRHHGTFIHAHIHEQTLPGQADLGRCENNTNTPSLKSSMCCFATSISKIFSFNQNDVNSCSPQYSSFLQFLEQTISQ